MCFPFNKIAPLHFSLSVTFWPATILSLVLFIWSLFLWFLCLEPVRALLSSFFFFLEHIKCHLLTILGTWLYYCTYLFFIQKKKNPNTVRRCFGGFFSSFIKQKENKTDDICPPDFHIGQYMLGLLEVFSHISSPKRSTHR